MLQPVSLEYQPQGTAPEPVPLKAEDGYQQKGTTPKLQVQSGDGNHVKGSILKEDSGGRCYVCRRLDYTTEGCEVLQRYRVQSEPSKQISATSKTRCKAFLGKEGLI